MSEDDQIIIGDCLDSLRALPDSIAQCCITSPPYYGLRDYATRRWFHEAGECAHLHVEEHEPNHRGQVEQTKWKAALAAGRGQTATTSTCLDCGAWYGQLGLEPTPEMYSTNMVEIFREVRRVLRPDGVLWLNLGDSYTSEAGSKEVLSSLPAKNLIGVPWMTAFALRADGWILRSEVIWHKPNAMPESVQDRPTKSHEHVFLLTKKQDYFYDWAAIQESTLRQSEPSQGARNRRDVWSINTKPYKGSHFAVMPEQLARLCIRGGSKTGSLVLDPFAGSGTTLAVAKEMGRSFIGLELNPEYKPLIEERVRKSSEWYASIQNAKASQLLSE